MRLRAFRPTDLDVLHKIDRACFPPGISYSRQELADYIAQENSLTWIAQKGDAILGFVIADVPEAQTAHIITVDVLEDWRRSGVGTALMNAAEEWAGKKGAMAVYLETAEDNLTAQKFYLARGYTRVKTVEGYYPNGRAAWVMVKRLEGPGGK